MSIALETKGLQKQFGGLIVTRDLSVKFEAGARHALIGPNGAGKTTFINLLTGVLAPSDGTVAFKGRDITKVVRADAENARVAVRNVRRDVIADVKEALKEKLITQDDEKKAEQDIQKLTDKYVADIDAQLAAKEKEIMQV